jgi:hypothetical protein
MVQRESLDLALESTQPRAPAAHPAFTAGVGTGRTALTSSARVALFVFEVLMVHLVESCRVESFNRLEIVCALEPIGEPVIPAVIAAQIVIVDKDAFIHGGTS